MTHVALNKFRTPFYGLVDNLLETAFPSFNVEERVKMSLAPVNIHENEASYEIELLAPGLQKSDIKVEIDAKHLSISYEKSEQQSQSTSKVIRKEFSTESFKRVFALKDQIDAQKIEAKYEAGVLKVTLPKIEKVADTKQSIAIQ